MIYQIPSRRFAIILFLIIIVVLGGTVGYHLIEKWSFIESFYMTVITISTVGFAEVSPLSSIGRIFTVILIMTGVVIITTGLSLIFSSVMEGTFGEVMRRQRMEKKLAKMKEHFIICGSGVVGEDVLNEFIRARAPFVIIDKDANVLAPILKQFPETIYVIGDATNDETLKKAGIEEARGIIAVLGSDSDNLYICLTARSLNPRLRIIARAIESEAIDKLKKAGADYVFSPEKIGGVRLAAAALKPTVTSFLDAVLKGEYLNLVLDEVEVKKNSCIVDKTLKETNISRDIGIIIVAIKSTAMNKLTFNPSSDSSIHEGDILISFGTPEQISQLQKACRASPKIL